MRIYAKSGTLNFGRNAQTNVVSWNAKIASYLRCGYLEEALALFSQMQQAGTQPDEFTFASVLPACAGLAALEHGKRIHEDIIDRGFLANIFVGNALVDMYAKCGGVQDARHVFDKMPQRNVVSWTSITAGYARNGHAGDALKLFQKMPERNVVSWTAMIAGYAQNGQVDEALILFKKMPERNLVSWNAMIAGCVRNDLVEEALKLFQKMPDRDTVSWNAIVTGNSQNGHVDGVLNLFMKMPKQSVVSWNAVIAGYARNGHVDEVLKVFQKMPERNVISWNTIFAGCERKGHYGDALKLFRQMQVIGVKPVPETFSCVLPACASLSSLKRGKEVHQIIMKCLFQAHVFVGSGLVDMYAKCGSLEDACKVFDRMPERNVVSWNAMIAGYAVHGCGKEALQLFEQMLHSSTKPDHVTFVGVLSACSHSGLVDEGWQCFDRMCRDYCITPSVEHYTCMVDLLGRAGHLEEARDFIDKMPIKPSASAWGSLLGACRIHTNISLGKHVAERLFELEPRNAGNYALLSSIYAATGRPGDVQRVQRLRKDRMTEKSPGRSWIEVNNQVHSFLVRDRSHPQTHKIYAELERLSRQMKEAGYEPDTNLVLHDMEEHKEYILCQSGDKSAFELTPIHFSSRISI